MGLSISNPSSSTPTVTVTPTKMVTKSNTAGQALLSASATTSSTNGTMGSWAQVTASTAAEYYIGSVGAIVTTTTGSGWYGPILVDIGIGGAGAETLVASVVIMGEQTYNSSAEPSGFAALDVPLRVAAGTRVAIRASLAATGAATRAVLTYLSATPVANVEGN